MLRVNDLFCGAGGMGLGFKLAGFDIPLAVDFDKYAVESYRENLGDHVQERDITQMTWEDMPQAEVWTFGFPCQDLSVAGRGAGLFEGKRSRMFFEVMRLLDEMAEHAPERLPKILLAENVQGLKKYLNVLRDEYEKRGYKMQYTLFNSKFWDVAQNRKRYFVAGVHKSIKRAFAFPTQQENKEIPKLASVLEKDVDEKYYIKDIKALEIIEQIKEGLKVKEATRKGYAIATEGDTININYPTSTTRRGRVGKQICNTLTHLDLEHTVVERMDKESARCQTDLKRIVNLYGHHGAGKVWDVDGISPSLTSSTGGHNQPFILEKEYTAKEMQHEVFETEDGAAYCCLANYWKGLGPSCINKSRRTHIIEDGAEQGEFRIRKLTPREFARLQGFPDSYKQVVSNTQFYKQMGNAVTVTVAQAIAEQISAFLTGASFTPAVAHEQLELIPLDLGEENRILKKELEKTRKELERVKNKVRQLALDI